MPAGSRICRRLLLLSETRNRQGIFASTYRLSPPRPTGGRLHEPPSCATGGAQSEVGASHLIGKLDRRRAAEPPLHSRIDPSGTCRKLIALLT
jgi:hypothetical protein